MRVELPGGTLDTRLRVLLTEGGDVALREKEARLFEVLVGARGATVDRETLNREVFDYAPGVASRTLDATVNRLRKKLKHAGADEAIQNVYGEGYRYRPTWRTRARRITGYQEAERSLRQALARPGVVVVTGSGGVGKSALVEEVLADVDDGVVLPCLGDRALVSRVVEAVGMPSAPVDAVAEALELRRDLVLVLENAEVLDAEAVETAVGWARPSSTLRLVLVSRLRLAIPGAVEIALDGLEREHAIALFTAHAQVEPGPAATGLVQQLDRHPLSLLLAARRVRRFGLEAFQAHLARNPDQLGTDLDAAPGQHSLASVLSTTIALLPEGARQALIELGAVDDALGPEAVLAVLSTGSLDVLDPLMDAHLVLRGPDGILHLHPRTRAWVGRIGAASIQDAARRRYLGHLAQRVRDSLPMAHLLPSIDTLARAEKLARSIGSSDAGLLLYGLCRALHDRGDPTATRPGLRELADDDPYRALVAAHLTRQDQPGEVALGTHAIERAGDDPALAVDAWLQRGSVLAYHGRTAEAIADLDRFEALAAGFGEAATVWSWLWTAVVCRHMAPEHASERLRRVEPHLDQLDHGDVLRWYANTALIAGRRLDYARSLELCHTQVALAEAHGDVLHRAQAYVLRGPFHWWLGHFEESRADMEEAFRLAPAGPRWIQVNSAINLGSMAMYLLDWRRSRQVLGVALLRAGTSERARTAAEIEVGVLDRELGLAGGDEPGPRVPGGFDDHWFLWPAQCGDLQRSVELAERVLAEGAPLDVYRVRSLGAAAEVFVAAGRLPQAREALDSASSSTRRTVEHVPLVALQQVVNALDGRSSPAWSPPTGQVPYLQVQTDLWHATHLGLVGDRRTAEALLDEVSVRIAHPELTERGALRWRLRVARSLVAG